VLTAGLAGSRPHVVVRLGPPRNGCYVLKYQLVPYVSRWIFPVRLDCANPVRSRVLIRSGCFGAGFDEGEPLVAEIGDDLQAAAEGFDVGGLSGSKSRPAPVTWDEARHGCEA
jgi:hypothetical protein